MEETKELFTKDDMIQFAEYCAQTGRSLYDKRVLIDSDDFDENKLPNSNVWLMYGQEPVSTETLLNKFKRKN